MQEVLRQAEGGGLLFECPGCGNVHVIYHGKGFGPRWEWNGDLVRPTFSPSLKVSWVEWTPSATDPGVRAAIQRGEIVQKRIEVCCHSFIRDGQIQFLPDCTHELAGKTVPIPPWQ